MSQRAAILQASIAVTLAGLGFIYYQSEVKPFKYIGYDTLVTGFEKFDAELNESIVQTRFGMFKNYDPIAESVDGLKAQMRNFEEMNLSANSSEFNFHVTLLRDSVDEKLVLTDQFMRLNPNVTNAITSFSKIMGGIIDQDAVNELVESCLLGEFEYQINDKINQLFRGLLIYTSLPTESLRQNLLKVIEEIRPEADTKANLPLALQYGEYILVNLPELNRLNRDILEVQIIERLEQVVGYLSREEGAFFKNQGLYRVILFVLSVSLLVGLIWAFRRLEGMVDALNIEVVEREKAQEELAETNRDLEARVEARTADLAEKNTALNDTLGKLEEAQDQLIMQEKMASVGMLTTGVAHEIKNPLNFINNFSELSVSLVEELQELLDELDLKEKDKADIDEVIQDLATNNEKINMHGERADNIVQNMLMHSEQQDTTKYETNINELVDANVNSAEQSFLTQHEGFVCEIEIEKASALPTTFLAQQAVGRVVAYVVNNALYAVHEAKSARGEKFFPKIRVKTEQVDDALHIVVWDNGNGIPESDFKKIFEPFYTTKPTGKGNTGLGLSICYDAIAKQHKGDIQVRSEEGVFTEFTIILPITSGPKDSDGEE